MGMVPTYDIRSTASRYSSCFFVILQKRVWRGGHANASRLNNPFSVLSKAFVSEISCNRSADSSLVRKQLRALMDDVTAQTNPPM